MGLFQVYEDSLDMQAPLSGYVLCSIFYFFILVLTTGCDTQPLFTVIWSRGYVVEGDARTWRTSATNGKLKKIK